MTITSIGARRARSTGKTVTEADRLKASDLLARGRKLGVRQAELVRRVFLADGEIRRAERKAVEALLKAADAAREGRPVYAPTHPLSEDLAKLDRVTVTPDPILRSLRCTHVEDGHPVFLVSRCRVKAGNVTALLRAELCDHCADALRLAQGIPVRDPNTLQVLSVFLSDSEVARDRIRRAREQRKTDTYRAQRPRTIDGWQVPFYGSKTERTAAIARAAGAHASGRLTSETLRRVVATYAADGRCETPES